MKKTIALATACFAVALFNCCKKENISPFALSSFSVSDMYTETALPVQKPVTHYVNANIGGYLEALPAHYSDHPKKKYPVIFFLNGSGSLGDGSKLSLTVEDNIAIPYLIAKGKFPANFTVNNFTYQFIVLTPQFKSWPQASDVNDMIKYAINKYKIDTTRMYVCGLSMGGGTAWDDASTYGKGLAAVVPICGASAPTNQKAQDISKNTVAVWAFHNSGDPTVPSSYSSDWVKDINNNKPHIRAKLTMFQASVHDAWSKATNPNYTENGMNIYTWMLTFRKKMN
jgi:predicted peptidase